MYTRFSTTTSQFVMHAPMLKTPPDAPGAPLLAAIGGAYECEEQHLRARILREAINLQDTASNLPKNSRQAAFLEALSGLISFLESETDGGVTLFTSDRPL